MLSAAAVIGAFWVNTVGPKHLYSEPAQTHIGP